MCLCRTNRLEHVGAPPSEALDGRDPLPHLVVRELVEKMELKVLCKYVTGEIAQVADLRPGEAGGAQFVLVGGEDLLRCRGTVAEKLDEARVDRPCRLSRELLADDGAHERAVGVAGTAPAPGAGAERSDPAYERRQDGVPALQ
jgi:hypothetical protein